MFNVPDTAVACFEGWSGFNLAFYDNMNYFSSCFSINREYHYHALCENIKCGGKEEQCYDFDSYATRRNAIRFRNGGIKICHAGVLELLMPVYVGDLLAAMMVAGVRRPPEKLPFGVPVLQAKTVRNAPGLSGIRKTTEKELATVLEGLRQLAARLRYWLEEKPEDLISSDTMSRAAIIELEVQRNGREGVSLARIAALLHLSRSRAAHAVREATGKSLSELVLEQRLERARILLEHSDHTIASIARSSGFSDSANFHRLFKRAEGATPARYRRRVRRQAAEPDADSAGP